MRLIRDPQQTLLFDPFDGVLSPMARNRLVAGWEGVVRTILLKQLPVQKLAEHFCPDDGAPTKELYSMAGLVFLADFFRWDAQVAADNYMMHAGVQFALNIQPGVELSVRTVERYQARFQNDDAAWELYVELLTRITTQPLPADHGVEKSALDSVDGLFGLTRDIIKRHGRGCAEFTKLAIVILNQVVRPVTAKWHRLSTDGAFQDPQQCQVFRQELTSLQTHLIRYTQMLAALAGVEDWTKLEADVS